MIQLVVFDMAGTTVHDSQNVHQCLQTALLDYDFSFSLAEINPFMGIPKPLAIKELLKKYFTNEAEISENLIDNIYHKFLSYMIEFYQTDESVRERENATWLFEELKQKGIKIALDTGFSREVANAIIERLNWQHKIDVSVTSDEVAQGRPFPDLIFKAMQLTDIQEVEKVAKVGDTPVDMQEGNSAGCQLVIGITGGANTAEELAQENPSHIVHNLKDVLDIISA
jgi:phosphonatase-like hydrolase